MKRYLPSTDYIIRINISQQGVKEVEHINVYETTVSECEEFVRNVISTNVRISPFDKGHITRVYLREALGAKNGKTVSVSFRGLSPKDTMALLEKAITEQEISDKP